MENNIEKILEDIYSMDDSLRAHEKEIEQVVVELIAARPEAAIDERFLLELRRELVRRSGMLAGTLVESLKVPGVFNFSKLAYAFGGAALVLLIAVPFLNFDNYDRKALDSIPSAQNAPAPRLNEVAITKQGNDAFGALGGLQSGDAASREAVQADNLAQAPLAMDSKIMGMGGGGVAGGDARMIMPEYSNYEYVYKGEGITAPAARLEVYKKIKNKLVQGDFARNLASLDFGVLDLSKFRNAEISNFNLVEDREFGYSIYFNLAESQFSVGSNWEKWPRPEADCSDQACFERYRLSIGDVPVDDELIAIADRFLRDYGIEMKNYAQGEVLDQWRRSYDEAADKSLAWVPDAIQVVYPLLLNGELVYDEGGNKTGIMVEVNIRHKKVSGLNNVMALAFESSDYEAETDIEVIKKVAENGGRFKRYYYGEANDAKSVAIELGTPKLALVQYWNYDLKSGESGELYVPSYVFPVINKPADIYFYQESVIVPLIKDMLKEANDGFDPTPRPMPLIERGEIMMDAEEQATDPSAEQLISPEQDAGIIGTTIEEDPTLLLQE